MDFLKFLILVTILVNVYSRHTRASRGTYRYVNKHSGRTHYVGATNNFHRRHREHQRAGHYYANSNTYKLVKNYMPHSSHEKIYQREVKQIKQYNPLANKVRGGNGKREKHY